MQLRLLWACGNPLKILTVQRVVPAYEMGMMVTAAMQAKGTAGDGMLQKLQRSVSAKAAPLLALAGMAQPNVQDIPATHELLPLKAVLRRELQLDTMQSGSQSIEPLLQTGKTPSTNHACCTRSVNDTLLAACPCWA